MMWDLDDLAGIADIAELAGVGDAAVANWRKRHRDTFPKPILKISRGTPIFSRKQVTEWLRETGRMP